MPSFVILSCLHTMEYDPVPRDGDILWCTRCKDYKSYAAPKTLFKHEVLCMDCRRLQPKTRGYIGSEARAIKHSLAWPGHRVGIWVDGELDQVFYRERVNTLDGSPPF